jgi:hypothetical protein
VAVAAAIINVIEMKKSENGEKRNENQLWRNSGEMAAAKWHPAWHQRKQWRNGVSIWRAASGSVCGWLCVMLSAGEIMWRNLALAS